jgi:hypothetical protein
MNTKEILKTVEENYLSNIEGELIDEWAVEEETIFSKEEKASLSHGKKIAEHGKSIASELFIWKGEDTMHPKTGRKSSVCALCAGNIIEGAGYVAPDDGKGNIVTSAANFFDQITGHPYAVKNYNTEFMKNKEYKNWKIISKMEDIQPGDVILFKGTGYDEMMAGNPTSSNPSGYHISISTTEWHDPYSVFGGVSGGISLVDDQGSATPIRHRNKYATDMKSDFVKAARYIGK